MAPAWSNIEQELRRAAERHRYEEVERLAARLGSEATARLAELPPDSEEVRHIAGTVLEVLHWALLMVRVAREAQANELSLVCNAGHYIPHGQIDSAAVRLEA